MQVLFLPIYFNDRCYVKFRQNSAIFLGFYVFIYYSRKKQNFLIQTVFTTTQKINNKKIPNTALVCSLSVLLVENLKSYDIDFLTKILPRKTYSRWSWNIFESVIAFCPFNIYRGMFVELEGVFLILLYTCNSFYKITA